MKLKILAIGAHQDDVELSMSGALLKHIKEKDEVYIIIATNGEEGGDPESRRQDSKNCADQIKAKIFFLGCPDTQLNKQDGLIQIIENHIGKIKPGIIYTHYPEDTHQDHRALSKAVQTAGRNTKTIIFFESPSSLNFIPNYFVDVSKFIEQKVKLLKQFKTKTKTWYWEVKTIKGNAMFRGNQARVKFAEAFHVMRVVR